MNRATRCLVASSTVAITSIASATALASGETTEPPTGSVVDSGAPGCAEITAFLDSTTAVVVAMLSEDPAALESVLEVLPAQAAAAVDAAPDEIAADAETMVATVEDIVAAMEGVDLADPEAVIPTMPAGDEAAADAAYTSLLDWATTNCGYVAADPFAEAMPDAPEPPECDVLDAAAAAEAAGIDVDVADADGSGDFNLPGFWTKSCSYGNGAMSLSTLSFNLIEDAQRFYADNLDESAGVVLDIEAGSLPASTLVIQTGVATADGTSVPGSDAPTAVTPSVQVTVFEAPVPFSVSFTGDDVDPAAVVAAAEALFAAQLEEAGAPQTTVA